MHTSIHKLFISIIGLMLSTISYGMVEQTELIVKNISTWKIEITSPERKIVDPGQEYTFLRLPKTIVFKSYGKVWGIIASEYTINIDAMLQDVLHKSLDNIPTDNNIIITINTEGIRRQWKIDIEVEPRYEAASHIMAELRKNPTPLALFPRLQPHDPQEISPQEEARYILELPKKFSMQELTTAYQASLIRLNALKGTLPTYKNLIDAAITLVNQAKLILEKNLSKKVSQRELDEFHHAILQSIRSYEPTSEKLSQEEIFSELPKKEFIVTARELGKQYITELDKAGYPFIFIPHTIDITPYTIGIMMYLRRISDEVTKGSEHHDKGIFPNILQGTGVEGGLIGKDRRGSEHLKKLTQVYKIHLMPKDADLMNALQRLLNAIKQEPELQETISFMKIKPISESIIEQMRETAKDKPYPYSELWRLPKIILYVGGGKKQAQRALNKLYELFKDYEGLGRGPAFNKKVTNYIYFAQGNREDKILHPEYFEQGEMIYFITDINGAAEDFHLINPATGKRE